MKELNFTKLHEYLKVVNKVTGIVAISMMLLSLLLGASGAFFWTIMFWYGGFYIFIWGTIPGLILQLLYYLYNRYYPNK